MVQLPAFAHYHVAELEAWGSEACCAWQGQRGTFVGAELEEEFAKLAARRIGVTERGSLLREISEQFWDNA